MRVYMYMFCDSVLILDCSVGLRFARRRSFESAVFFLSVEEMRCVPFWRIRDKTPYQDAANKLKFANCRYEKINNGRALAQAIRILLFNQNVIIARAVENRH